MCHIFLKTRGKIQSISDDSMYHDHHQYDQEAQKHHLSTKVSCLVPTNMNVYHQTTSAVCLFSVGWIEHCTLCALYTQYTLEYSVHCILCLNSTI